MARVADIDVDREEHAVAIVGRNREGLAQAFGQAACPDPGGLQALQQPQRHGETER